MIYVAGGSGFIGTSLCRRLEAAGKLFTIVDKAGSVSFPACTRIADVRDPGALMNAFMDASESADNIIINLAAEHHDNVSPVSLYDELNVYGAKNICETAKKKNINRIVFTSSVAVYGFAPPGTDENGSINYFNHYGRTKWLAENIYREWLQEDPAGRSLVIIRPTVVFGENNRGNVYNLMSQIASGRFIMVGNGKNRKSMAYVENVTAFIEYALSFKTGIHLYNYIDKPDMDMNTLVALVKNMLGKKKGFISSIKVPYGAGLFAGYLFDALSAVTGKKFPVSSIRIKKFTTDTLFGTSLAETGFVPPVKLDEGLRKTIHHEFLNKAPKEGQLFYSE